ncbi:hypothetical protein [Alicyclobacillus shizuokensis]|uniref:hypothetical protein n=1 Tax=Alicyclobacillus shizuokensis TaxID=392014 RepID=UPI0008359759|nr:hypothetical protein [Alicyclobacillus shizuokensis]
MDEAIFTQKDLEELRTEHKQMSQTISDIIARLTIVETNHASMADDVKEQKGLISEIRKQLDSLTNSSTETKVQINMIFSTLHEIKQSVAALQRDGQDTRDKHHSAWTEFLKQVIYFFIMGGITLMASHMAH